MIKSITSLNDETINRIIDELKNRDDLQTLVALLITRDGDIELYRSKSNMIEVGGLSAYLQAYIARKYE